MNYQSKYLKYKDKYLSLVGSFNASDKFWSDNIMNQQLRGRMNQFLDIRDSINLRKIRKAENTLYKTHLGDKDTCFEVEDGPYISGKDNRCPNYRYKNIGLTPQGKNTLCCNNKVIMSCIDKKRVIDTQKLYNCAKILIGLLDEEFDGNKTVLDFYLEWSNIPLENNQLEKDVNQALENDWTLNDFINKSNPYQTINNSENKLHLWNLIEVIFGISEVVDSLHQMPNEDEFMTDLGDIMGDNEPTLRDISIDDVNLDRNSKATCVWPKFIWAIYHTFTYYKKPYEITKQKINWVVSYWNGENKDLGDKTLRERNEEYRNQWYRVSNNFDSLFKKFYYDTNYERLEGLGY